MQRARGGPTALTTLERMAVARLGSAYGASAPAAPRTIFMYIFGTDTPCAFGTIASLRSHLLCSIVTILFSVEIEIVSTYVLVITLRCSKPVVRSS